MSPDTLSTRLRAVSESINFHSLPAPTQLASALHWLDGVGVTAGGVTSGAGTVARAYLASLGSASTPAEGNLFLPRSEQGRPDDDAFLYGSYAFSENYGDTSLRSVAHPNTVVVPALLSAARARPVPGERILSALVVGYQVMEFLARSLNNGSPRMGHQIRGFRPSASTGAVGAAAAIAHAWGLPSETAQAAIEIACNYGGGLRRHGPGPTSSIRVHSGESARGGMTAVLLASSGLLGEQSMIEGDGGFLPAYMADQLDEGAEIYLTTDFWAIDDVAFKLHSTAHTLHTALDCILDLVELGLRPQQIQAIEISVPAQHATISASTPYQPPSTAAEASGSYPFCAGVAAVTGDYVWPEQLHAYLGTEEVERIAAATRVIVDGRQTEIFDRDPGTWPASVLVRSETGILRQDRREPRGLHVDNRLEQDLMRKFRRLAGRTRSAEEAESFAAAVMAIEGSNDSYETLSSI